MTTPEVVTTPEDVACPRCKAPPEFPCLGKISEMIGSFAPFHHAERAAVVPPLTLMSDCPECRAAVGKMCGTRGVGGVRIYCAARVDVAMDKLSARIDALVHRSMEETSARHGNELYAAMQNPGFEGRMTQAFRASPEEIGRAAVEGAQKHAGGCTEGQGHLWKVSHHGDAGEIVQCMRCQGILSATSMLPAYLKDHPADSIQGWLAGKMSR